MKNKVSVSMALIAIVISLFSILLALISIVAEFIGIGFDIDVPREEGASPFALWVYSVLIAMLSLLFHVIYAVLSVEDVYLKINPVLNLVTILMICGAIPMVIFVGGGPGVPSLIWNLYYAAMIALEILSITKGIEKARTSTAEKESL